MFVDSFIENNTKHQNKRFSDYIRTWVSKGRDKGSEIPSYENYQNDFDSLPPECKILAWNGMSFPNEQCLYQLTDWIERGGGFICGVCPSKFVYINNIEIEDMPLNYIFRKIDVVYAGSETYICDNDETFIREIDTDCVKLQDVISMAKMNPEKCVKLSNMVLHLPGQVYDLYKPDIIDILQKLGQGDHYIPSVELPVNSINGKKAAILKCNLMIRDGLDGNLVTAEGIEEFPGTFSETPELQSIQMVFTSVGSQIHSTGYYLPAGFLIEISWNNTNKPWIIRIGLHKADLSNVTSGFRRWPKIAIRKVMKSSPIQICSPFGGLVYLESPNEINDKIVCKIDNVVPAPTFTFKTASKWELFERSKPGLWCDIIGDKITFTLPSSSIRSLPDPTKTMKLWDSIVGAHIKLRGKDTSNGIGEWVITDEQLHIDDAYMVSGYPIVIHLDMADPNKVRHLTHT